jgi:hypothetical protein
VCACVCQAYSLQENYKAAIDVYLEALEFSPENPGGSSPHCEICVGLFA